MTGVAVASFSQRALVVEWVDLQLEVSCGFEPDVVVLCLTCLTCCVAWVMLTAVVGVVQLMSACILVSGCAALHDVRTRKFKLQSTSSSKS